MLDKSLFEPKTEIQSKEFDFPSGKVTLHFRLLSCTEHDVLIESLHTPDGNKKSNLYAWAIATSLCNADGSKFNDDGTAVITQEQVKTLKREVFIQLMNFVLEINLGKKEVKPLQAKTGSGTS